MGTRCRSILLKHLHVLLIVPLVVIVMTWPTFARVFDSEEYWFHTRHLDLWFRQWDAWHIERVLAGQAQLFYSDAMFHPIGASLAWQHLSFPHAALLMVLRHLMPADSAYNLLFLLILCFNSYCGYILILYLLDNKWIALFGATVVGFSIPFPGGSTTPDLIIIGTIPLTIYFLHRHIREKRYIFAALAGVSAGVTAFIGVYTFVIILITFAFITIFKAVSHWKQPAFRRGLLLFIVVCGSISSVRFYPMFADAAVLKEGLDTHLHKARSNDVLECCVLTGNPITGDLLHWLFNSRHTLEETTVRQQYNIGYYGYINLFLVLCALLHKPLRTPLAPWLVLLVVFSILRLGDFLTFNGQEYHAVRLPEHFLSKWFPALFGNIGKQEYYQYGVVTPLAILASSGLARLIQSRTNVVQVAAVLLSLAIVAIEFYAPLPNMIVEREKMAFDDWLSTEPDGAIKLINLPQGTWPNLYYLGLQTFHGYPIAFGNLNRNPVSARTYVRDNLLLQAWDDIRSVHCLPHGERTFLSALDRLLADGFSHVVVHDWFYGDRYVDHTFWNVPAAYDNGLVTVYRLRDLRLSCESKQIELPHIKHFAESPSAIPGRRSSILSLHPSESIDEGLFAYLASLFSDWRSLVHLYLDDGEPVFQSAGESARDLEAIARDNQVIYLIYNRRDLDSAALHSQISFEEFNLCQREAFEDGSVIEQYLLIEFSCDLVAARKPVQVDYDNGARLANAAVEITQDFLEVQFMWSILPSEPHSVSLQVFDEEGAKALGQDSTIGQASLARHRVDISALPPGEYQAKLIVYNYNTSVSVPGTVSAESLRFERELEIATLDRT